MYGPPPIRIVGGGEMMICAWPMPGRRGRRFRRGRCAAPLAKAAAAAAAGGAVVAPGGGVANGSHGTSGRRHRRQRHHDGSRHRRGAWRGGNLHASRSRREATGSVAWRLAAPRQRGRRFRRPAARR